MDEIFGEDNFVAELIIEGTPKSDPSVVSIKHEYCLVYSQDKTVTSNFDLGQLSEYAETLYDLIENCTFEEAEQKLRAFYREKEITGNIKNYKYVDKDGIFRTSPIDDPQENGIKDDRINPKTGRCCATPTSGWRCTTSTWDDWVKDNLIWFPENDNQLPAKKTYLKPQKKEVLTSIHKFQTRKSTQTLINMFGKKVFSYPKPIEFMQLLLEALIPDRQDFIILDCFAGSGTTAHAHFLNQVNKSIRGSFILLTLPEPLESNLKKAKSNKAKEILKNAISLLEGIDKPRNIAEITKERLRRAGAKIRQEHPLFHGDLGFKVFKLAESTIAPKHRNYSNRGDFENEARTVASQNKERLLYSTQTDPYAIAWEVAIKHGYELTETVNSVKLGNLTGYAIFPPKPEERRALHQPKLLVIPTGVLNGKEDIWAFTRDLQGAFPSHHFVLWEGLFQGNDSFKRSVMDAILAFKDQLTDVKGNPAHTEQLRIEVIRL